MLFRALGLERRALDSTLAKAIFKAMYMGEVVRLTSLKPQQQTSKTFVSSFNRHATLGTLPQKMFRTQSDDGLTKRLEV